MVSRVKAGLKGQWSQESSAVRYQAGWRVESLKGQRSQGSRLKVSRVSGLKVKVESLHRQWSQGSRLKVTIIISDSDNDSDSDSDKDSDSDNDSDSDKDSDSDSDSDNDSDSE